MNTATKAAIAAFTVFLMIGCIGSGGGGVDPGGADELLGIEEDESDEPSPPDENGSNANDTNDTSGDDNEPSITVIQENDQTVSQEQSQEQKQEQDQDQKAKADADADVEAGSNSASESNSESSSESESKSVSNSESESESESRSTSDSDADADSDANSDASNDDPSAPTVEFIGCSDVEITGDFEYGEIETSFYASDGSDSEVYDLRPESGDAIQVTAGDLGLQSVNGYYFSSVYLEYGDGEELYVRNQADCDVRPAAPSMTFVDGEANDDGTIEATFAYENPNEVSMDINPEITQGTVGDRYPDVQFDPGEGTFSVTWTPDDPDETLVVEADLTRFGHDETITAETPPASDFLEFGSGEAESGDSSGDGDSDADGSDSDFESDDEGDGASADGENGDGGSDASNDDEAASNVNSNGGDGGDGEGDDDGSDDEESGDDGGNGGGEGNEG